LFAQLTDLANTSKGGKHKGVEYPSPEEFLYSSKTAGEQRNTRISWASRPPEWLSNFSFSTTYAGLNVNEKKLAKLFSEVAQMEADFNEWAANSLVSTSSTIYQDQRSLLDLREASLATDLGLSKVWELHNASPAQRMLEANLTQNANFADFTRRAADTNALFALTRETQGGVPTALSSLTYAQFNADVDRARISDPLLDSMLTYIAQALGEGFGQPLHEHDMYAKVFFDYHGPPRNLPQLAAA